VPGIFSPRSGRNNKAWGGASLGERNPRANVVIKFPAREAGDRTNAPRRDLRVKGCRPFHGLARQFILDPGACAPGFILSPASQAKTEGLFFLLRRLYCALTSGSFLKPFSNAFRNRSTAVVGSPRKFGSVYNSTSPFRASTIPMSNRR